MENSSQEENLVLARSVSFLEICGRKVGGAPSTFLTDGGCVRRYGGGGGVLVVEQQDGGAAGHRVGGAKPGMPPLFGRRSGGLNSAPSPKHNNGTRSPINRGPWAGGPVLI